MSHVTKETILPAAETEAIKARLSAPAETLLAWAAQAPDRLLLTSNASGRTQVYAWDRKTGVWYALPAVAKSIYTFLAPRGDQIIYVEDENDSEVGRLMRVAWGAGGLGSPEPITDALPPLYIYGLQIARDGTLFFAGSGGGVFRIYRLAPGDGEATVLYEHTHEAYLPYLSADESLLAFCTSEPANNRHWQTTVLDARTGSRVAHLSDGDAFSVTPARWLMGAADLRPWSPVPGDDRLLVTSNASGESRPAVWNARTKARQEFSLDDLPGEVTPHGWLADARSVILRQVHEGRVQLWRADLETGALVALPHAAGTVAPLPPFDDGTLWYSFSSLSTPPQTRAINAALDDSLETVVLPPQAEGEETGPRWESVHYESADGTDVHGFLGVPDGSGPFPALIYLHGGPTAQVTDAHVASWNDLVRRAGYVVFALNFRGSTGYGRDFQEAINGQPGRLELEDMAAARDYLLERGLARPDRIGLMGGSYGGFLTLLGLTRQPELWAAGYAAVPMCDWTMMYEDANQRLKGWAQTLLTGTPSEKPDIARAASPITYAENLRAPVRIIAHKSDTRCPIRQVEAFLRRLDALGIPFEAEISEGGHGTRSRSEAIEQHTQMAAFFDRY